MLAHKFITSETISAERLVKTLRYYREKGATYAEIGRAFGVSYVAVLYWVSGRQRPSRQILTMAPYVFAAVGELPAGLPQPGEMSSPSSHKRRK